MRKLLIPLAAALLAAPFSLLSNASMAAAPVSFTTIDWGFNSSWPATGGDVVVRTQEQWKRTWQLHSPGTTAPSIDFTQNDVYCSFMGWVFIGGVTVEITGVNAEATKVAVVVKNTHPGSNCNVIGIVTNPFHIVSVPKQAPVPVGFRHQIVVNDCP
ncbi:MAG: hypothetical protein ACKVS6_07005 [Planctomycetota bacterium]